MRLRALLVLAAMAAFFVTFEARGEGPVPKNAPGFNLFKGLAGEWTGTGVMGGQSQDVTVNYKVTSAGNAVLETLFSGTPHEMISVIHPDGDHLSLTHYCAMGNQPRMIAAGPENNVIAFKFNGGSNIQPDLDDHMHSATYTFVDRNTLHSEWTHYHKGKAVGTATLDLKRKRQ
jgi:hypothetical protein